MELVCNSVGMLVAFACVCLWLRSGRRTVEHRRLSLIGLVMLVAILFPVISVSDDLWSLQNPAETDTCQRRDHRDANAHANFPVVSALPEMAGFDLQFEFLRIELPRTPISRVTQNPAFDSIENRPPPVA